MVPSNNLFSISVSSWLNCSQPASAVASVVDSSASTWLFWRGSARLRRSALLLRSLLLSRLIWETWLLCQRWSVPWWESTTARPSTRWKSRWAPFAISPTPSETSVHDLFGVLLLCRHIQNRFCMWCCYWHFETLFLSFWSWNKKIDLSWTLYFHPKLPKGQLYEFYCLHEFYQFLHPKFSYSSLRWSVTTWQNSPSPTSL